MVAEITNLQPGPILYDLPVAQGLQYQALWLEKHGRATVRPRAGFDSGAFAKAAGFENP
jgi:hypothetical protein